METLTSRQRARLRALAHDLKPVVHVGAAGVTDATLQSVAEAFNTRELLKVRILEGAPDDPRDVGDAIAEGLERVLHAFTIGRVAVLYRPFAEDPVIRL